MSPSCRSFCQRHVRAFRQLISRSRTSGNKTAQIVALADAGSRRVGPRLNRPVQAKRSPTSGGAGAGRYNRGEVRGRHLRRVVVLRLAATRFTRLPRPAIVAVGLVLITAIAYFDYLAGPRVLLNIFYLLPVMLVAWASGSSACGLTVAVGTFLVGPIEAMITDFHDVSLPVAIWNGAVRLSVFCVVLFLMAR